MKKNMCRFAKVLMLFLAVFLLSFVNDVDTQAAKTTKSVQTTTKKTTKKTKLKTASKKTYSKKTSKSKTSTKTTSSSKSKVVTQTVVKTDVLDQYKKASKVKVQVTTVKTTVTKTTTYTDTNASSVTVKKDISIAPKADARVKNAFKDLGYEIIINSKLSSQGYFQSKERKISLQKADDVVYHELGHFLAFVAGNYDKNAAFVKVYNAEKAKYKGTNSKYVLQNSSEYFAESFKDYTLNPTALKASRPQTYAAMQIALSKVTTSRVNMLKMFYK